MLRPCILLVRDWPIRRGSNATQSGASAFWFPQRGFLLDVAATGALRNARRIMSSAATSISL